MKRILLPTIFLALGGALFAARSQEPVVITTCRSFEARGGEESKTALAGRFRDKSCPSCGDCDDINKVCANRIISFDVLDSGRAVMKLEAVYPDGKSYNYFILFKPHETDASRPVEYWASSSEDFARSTYAIAISDEDKKGCNAIFSSAEIAPCVAPAILYALANDMSLTDAPQLARRNADLALLDILECMAGTPAGYTKEFVQSPQWFDISKRMEALRRLRDFILDNPKNLNINPSLDASGKSFACYMQKFSDEYAERTKAQFALESRDFNPAKTPILDADALAKAQANFGACANRAECGKSAGNSAAKFGGLSLKKKKSRRR